MQKSSLNAEDTEAETISLLDFRAVQIRGRERRTRTVPKKIRRKRKTWQRIDILSLETVPEVDENQDEFEDEFTTLQCCSFNKFLCISCLIGSTLLFIFLITIFYCT